MPTATRALTDIACSDSIIHLSTIVSCLSGSEYDLPYALDGTTRFKTWGGKTEHRHADSFLLEPRSDGMTPVLCTCHRRIWFLLNPAQRQHTQEYAQRSGLTFGQ